MPLSREREMEIATLAQRYGKPRRVVAVLPTNNFSPLNKAGRIGEVAMVVRRPDGHLITARKTFYPPDGYRLLTGGIKPDEQIEAALLRETHEETGLTVRVQRFLAIITYQVPPSAPPDQQAREFFTFAFLLDELGGNLASLDEEECIADFRMIRPDELPAMATTLEYIGDGSHEEMDDRWREWGIFRAVLHRVVFDVLQSYSDERNADERSPDGRRGE